MLTISDYLAIKARMLLAAEAASLIARSGDTVRFDEEMYPIVMEALGNSKDDVRKILAECDILRFTSHQEIFPALGVTNADHDAADNRGTVDPVSVPADETRRPEILADDTGVSSEVPTGGADGGQPVPKPRRNRKRKAADPKPVE